MKHSTLLLSTLCAAMLWSGVACKKTVPAITYTQVDPNTGATVSGTIRLKSTAKPRIEIDMAQDPACSMSGANMTEQIVTNNGGLANVFLYIKDGLGDKTYAIPTAPVKIDQKGCRFTPHVSGAMVGQQVQFFNSDPTMHNIHVTPSSSGNTGFDVSQGPSSGPESRQFQSPELKIQLRCNNHPWMQAYLNIVANPFFATSNSDGRYSIQGLPPGTYTLVAVQEQLGEKSTTITVESKQRLSKDFAF